MRARVRNIAFLGPLLLALAGGCATKALWQNERLEACKEPADKLNLRLFESQPQTNLLVVYEESSERNESVRTRAYWLNENNSRVEQRLRPHFIRAGVKRDLLSVPVFYDPLAAGLNLPPGLCAVVAANKHSFTLFLANHPIGTHDLPVYNDGVGQVAKIALTPVAVTVDLSIVGAVLVYVYAYSEDGWKPAGGAGPYD